MELTKITETIKVGTDPSGKAVRYFAFLKMRHMKRSRYVVSEVSLEDAIDQAKAIEIDERAKKDARRDELAKKREGVKVQAKEAAATVKPGQVFYDSWGYDQTNIDFYEVVSVKGITAMFRQIAQDTTETGFMCGTTLGLPGQYVGEPFKKRIQAWQGRVYFKSDKHGALSLWDSRPIHCSWYA